MEAFAKNMREQLEQLDTADSSDSLQEKLQRRRVEELLRDLDLSSDRTSREGTTAFDREQQDTTIRRREPPARFRGRDADYRQRILDGLRRRR